MYLSLIGRRISQVIRCAVCVGVLLVIGFYVRHHHRPERDDNARVQTASGGPIAPKVPSLTIESVVEHGHIVEVKGGTDPGATVMINGEPAAVIFDGASFRQFVGPLRPGLTVLTITAQNADGGVNTQQLAIEVMDR